MNSPFSNILIIESSRHSWLDLEKEYGVGWNSLEKHTAEEIFNHEYIQSILPLTWKDPSHRLCTYECQEMCGGGLHSAAWMASTNREEITR